MKEPVLYIDQYNGIITARTVKELQEKCGGGKVSKMYVDTKGGKVKHVGYVVGKRWFTMWIKKEKVCN